MTKDISGLVEQLVSKFDAGQPVDSILREINSDYDFATLWVHELDLGSDQFFYDAGLPEFFLVVPQEQIFVTDDDIREYYDEEFLLGLDREGIVQFVHDSLESSGETCASLHFYKSSPTSMISVFATPAGQAGMHYSDMTITHTMQDRIDKLIRDDFIFASNEKFIYPEDLLIEKYQKLVLDRLR